MTTLAKWSVDDYHRMIAAGILHDRRVELLMGEIVEVAPDTPLHYSTAKRGAKYLEQLLEGKADVRFNGPVTLADSEPEPDIAVVQLSDLEYSDRHPDPSAIFWVVEVAKTSVRKDIDLKAKIYATAEIPEYWVLNLQYRQMVVFRNPQQGQYTSEQVISTGMLSPLSFPEVQVDCARLLG